MAHRLLVEHIEHVEFDAHCLSLRHVNGVGYLHVCSAEHRRAPHISAAIDEHWEILRRVDARGKWCAAGHNKENTHIRRPDPSGIESIASAEFESVRTIGGECAFC